MVHWRGFLKLDVSFHAAVRLFAEKLCGEKMSIHDVDDARRALSARWTEGYERIAAQAGHRPQPRLVHVADREGDTSGRCSELMPWIIQRIADPLAARSQAAGHDPVHAAGPDRGSRLARCRTW